MINILKDIEIILRIDERNQIPFFLKIEASSVPTVLSVDNGDTITNPYDVVTLLIFTLLL